MREEREWPDKLSHYDCAICGEFVEPYTNPCMFCGRAVCDAHLPTRSPTICSECTERSSKGEDLEPIQWLSYGRKITCIT